MHEQNRLIIFVKNPQLGKVKTRLAQTIGNQQALEIYLRLLDHTKDISSQVAANRAVYYTDFIDSNDIWPEDQFQKYLQTGDDLGERMKNAFAAAFAEGFEKVVIIGSDCPQLTSAHIEEAFDLLNAFGAVIGPAVDGGYYLLGMSEFIPELFINKAWSSDQVLRQTLADLNRLEYSFYLLDELRDIDTEEDLKIVNI
ncbi:glycosyltransferase [Rhodocytophaga rosea]|uniref:Glycosyltransferase n=1 Tax=Rhodocytophaga rosea TaxID=2704465 RepID=A0A6C0GHX3_9BACT|nr:TIGR04282 family arsenosugar biosynthesis glycosyltransferase [Rhodocytophaga rosea]QHT67598.1 glycosyltransferase [Rhodocytophaga rosea]